jgi:predicted dehydrogenase
MEYKHIRRLRAAVIGTGFMGGAHIEGLRRIEGVDVVGVASANPELANETATRAAIPRAYNDWRDVLDDPSVDVVHNCTPNNLHHEVNLAVIRAGKHIFSEKPLAMTVAEARELLDAARDAGVVHAVNFNYRGYPLVQQARAMVASGEIGTPQLIHGHYLQDWLLLETDYNWRVSVDEGGSSRAMADIGSHWCDLVQFVSGRRIEAVCATMKTLHSVRKKPAEAIRTFESASGDTEDVAVTTEDAVVVMLRFEGGAIGSLVVSQISAGRKNHQWFEIDGTQQAIAWDQERPNELWIGNRMSPNQTLIKDASLMAGEAATYAHYPGGHPEGYPTGFKNIFRNVYRYIREGRDPRRDPADFATFAEGLRANLIVDAVLESHRTGGWVEVPAVRTSSTIEAVVESRE